MLMLCFDCINHIWTWERNIKVDMAYRPSAIKIIVLWKLCGSEKDIDFDIQTNGHKFLSWRHNC